ncbi:hypothetical protein SAMN05660748_0330 [Blastococcus aggregatus]|uniref:Uncharacterized protein n=1 Tax=Blastococcus aggregatus TaxID=38502 RepID=A0A285UXE9_9ACTN|nr:hypothetical protein [Blastococcus aggregatus]SOC46595.1 hypothetical protein SAMN05660748_0330 [Blastococcus aggregatus]
MSIRLTGTDLNQWSGRRSAQGELPAVVRQLIMATAQPARIVFPADEGIARPGLDGILTVTGDVGPFVPSGKSVWEASTNANPKGKASDDYNKRTSQTPADARTTKTFVFVTSRSWPDAASWVEEVTELRDGWKQIRVIEAEDLATWLSTCPGVHEWLAEHLYRPTGLVSLERWFTRWSSLTAPETPAALLLAGRRDDAVALLNDLDGQPTAIERCAASVEEVVAFLAATLTLGPGPDPEALREDAGAAPPVDEVDAFEDFEGSAITLNRAHERYELEAVLARTVVIENEDAWRRWSLHEQPQLLVPLFYPDSVQEAVGAGHHVVLPRVARDGNEPDLLTPLGIDAARTAWTNAGVDFRLADEFAGASRRNLRSLRRRIARHRRHRVPEWASGPSASLLATLLLAGGWNTNAEGDLDVVLALTERRTWRSLARDLTPLTSGDDPPLSELDKQWTFVDIVDAWDAIGGNLAAEDLELFMQQAVPVLTEIDPALHLVGKERIAFSIDPDRPRRRYSGTLREGVAATLAALGSIAGDRRIGGELTGSTVASRVVRDLLDDADANRWLTLSGRLPLLAEAAPDVFLDAVEKSLRQPGPAVMALFNETDDGFGQQRSHHSPLLWALETLAFSPAHVARVTTVLARLTDLDPGGRLMNRPLDSLVAILHLRIPQGAIDATNRLPVIDSVRRTSQAVAVRMMSKLVKASTAGMILRSGPRYREWPTPRHHSTYPEMVDAVDGITERLLQDTADGGDASRWTTLADLIGRITPQGRAKVVNALTQNWEAIDSAVRAEITKTVHQIADRHRRFPEAAWSMDADGIAELDAFLDAHGAVVEQNSTLFSWWPKEVDMATEEGRQELQRRRVEAVTELLGEGVDAISRLAHDVEHPRSVGNAVAHATTDLDETVLAFLDSEDPKIREVAYGLIWVRAQSRDWLDETVRKRPNQAGRLLLILDATDDVLDLVDTFTEDQRQLYWSQVDPVCGARAAVERFTEGLIAADRPFSAIDAVGLRQDEPPSSELVLKTLSAPLTRRTAESPQVLTSAEYIIGRLLDQLEEAGVGTDDLTTLEWFYLPLLANERLPRALHQRLADDPEFFAEVVSHMYQPDPPTDEEVAAGDVPEDEYQFSDACWQLMQDWREPLPGARYGGSPDPDLMHAWVRRVREELAERNRTGIASLAIGDALAGRTTDEDGVWPSLAVRTVLEREQDSRLEEQLAIARMNQRGVTVRGVYDGGRQERKLAEKYRTWADRVRDQWPRTGMLLDLIVKSCEADARRQDGSAQRQLRR